MIILVSLLVVIIFLHFLRENKENNFRQFS